MELRAARWLVGGFVVALLSVPALAADDKPIPEARQAQVLQKHPEWDANHDGKLTRDELKAVRTGNQARAQKHAQPNPAEFLAKYPDADTNRDGQLSPEEMHEYMRAHPEMIRLELARAEMRSHLGEMLVKEFPAADTDKDGKLTAAEIKVFMQTHGDEVRAAVLKRHPDLDTNRDGKLSPEEFREAMQSAANAGGPRAAMNRMILKRFPDADTNKDGQLSNEEFNAFRQQHGDEFKAEVLKRFPKADTNKDGQLSDEELQALRDRAAATGKNVRAEKGTEQPKAKAKNGRQERTQRRQNRRAAGAPAAS